jgi:hypothetical protein
MSGHGSKIDRKQDEAILALMTLGTYAEAAQTCGVAESTLRRWAKDPDFKREWRQRRQQVTEGVVAQLQIYALEAVQAFYKIMNDEKSTASARLTAARSIMAYAFKGQDALEMEERIAEIEALVSEQEEFGHGE